MQKFLRQALVESKARHAFLAFGISVVFLAYENHVKIRLKIPACFLEAIPVKKDLEDDIFHNNGEKENEESTT